MRVQLRIFIILLLLPFCSNAQIQNSLEFRCSDGQLENGFAWARQQASQYVHTQGDKVGAWYEASLPGRSAFCMRDVSHQLIGANVLGLASINKNMLHKFASSIAASRDWCGYWEIDKEDRPAPVDYKNDQDFWYNLPANFDLLNACYRQYLWTGDASYLNDPVFQNFYLRSCSDYVTRWDKNGDGIMEGSTDSKISYRGIGSYNEEEEGITGSDLIAAQYLGYRTYAEILDRSSSHERAQEFRAKAKSLQENFIHTWWDDQKNFPFQFLKKDGSRIHNNPMQLFLLRWHMLSPDRAKQVVEVLRQEKSKMNVEMLSYFPLELFRYSDDPATAVSMLKDLMSPDLKRREYPEVSFAALEAVTIGLMGIEPDASKNTIATISRLPQGMSATLSHLPVFNGAISVHHDDGGTKFKNESSENLLWKVCLRGVHKTVNINKINYKAEQEINSDGQEISYCILTVKPGAEFEWKAEK